MIDISFILTNILLGVALAMDAFSVSTANGLAEPNMKKSKQNLIAGTFGVFQYAMPMIGWVFVHYLVEAFGVLERFIPWTALALLAYLGIKMIIEGVKACREKKDGDSEQANGEEAKNAVNLTFKGLLVQGVATSIDALSVGLTIEGYNFLSANIASLIIGVVTYALCLVGLFVGKKFGTRFEGKATIAGGIILIGIGLEIFMKGIFF